MGWPIKLITGSELHCKNWQIEALLRMLYNNVVQGAVPEELIIYGGRGKAARNWECFEVFDRTLRRLKPDETLLVQSGKPAGVLRTHEHSPRALFANSLMVPQWCMDEEFWLLERAGLIMYGQMTAGSWSFIGQQGIMQGTYETFSAAGAGPGKLIVTAGLGNMGGAQAPAGKMTGATILIAEINPAKIERCQREGWVDEVFTDIGQAVDRAFAARAAREAVAIAVRANAVDLLEYLIRRNQIPDILTDQTSAHDPLVGYYPASLSFDEANRLRAGNPDEYRRRALETISHHVHFMVSLKRLGATTFEYGNGIRLRAQENGLGCAFEFQGFALLYVRPLFCQGRGPFRVVSLTGNPRDIAVIDSIILELFGDNAMLRNWIGKAQTHIDFSRLPGLPARVCWLGMGERWAAVHEIWKRVNRHEIGPIWVGRDHLDCGSVASPSRETEGMKDGTDAVADWPILNALVAASSGATWVSVHQGGGVGIGKSVHAGQCFVITGDGECLKLAERVFTNDPATGIIRHADAGYDEAVRAAADHHIDLPMINET
ncbi:MAG: urocanate hydratase [Patescibacteria group bacterium]